jgi:hypothetical protein
LSQFRIGQTFGHELCDLSLAGREQGTGVDGLLVVQTKTTPDGGELLHPPARPALEEFGRPHGVGTGLVVAVERDERSRRADVSRAAGGGR